MAGPRRTPCLTTSKQLRLLPLNPAERGVGYLGDAAVETVLADAGLAPSRGAARKLVASKGVRINGTVEEDVERDLDWQDALFGRYYLIRRGKKNWHLLARASS